VASPTLNSSQLGSLTEEELVSSLSWLITLRWLAGAGLILGTVLLRWVLGLAIVTLPLCLLGVGVLVYNAALWRVFARLNTEPDQSVQVYRTLAWAQIVLDWVGLALVMHFSGGIESPVTFFFLLHITTVALLLPHRKTYLYVTLAPALIGGVALLEYTRILPHTYLYTPGRFDDPFYVVSILGSFSATVYLMTYLSTRIAHRMRRREQKLMGLYQSVQASALTLDLSEGLSRLAEATAKALRCKGAAIRLLDQTGSFLEMAAAWGLSEAYLEKGPVEVARGPIDQEALSGHTVLVRDTAQDTRLRYPEQAAAEGIRSILSAPLIGKRGAIGVLRAYGGGTYRFTEDDAAFLSAIAAEGALAIENAQAYQLLETLDRSKSQFVRMVTHELRSPIQVTSSLLNVLSRGYVGTLNEEQADLVDRALRRLQFLNLLIDDLLDLAAGKADVLANAERGVVSLCDVLEDIQARFQASAQAKGLRFELACPAAPLDVWGNKAELDRIMNNLVSNAIKYTTEGSVRIWVERSRNRACISIADTGIGIPEEALPHLFEEFYRAPNAKATDEPGTGLGLAIVKDLVERYDGKIEVESAVGQGTTFTVTLPTIG
jgi:signal transduction histidine kinase